MPLPAPCVPRTPTSPRNTDTGLAAVQLSADMSVHKLPLDDISQYAGSADEDDE